MCGLQVLYEQRIEELERGASREPKPSSDRHTTLAALERDLQAAKEQHRKRVSDLQSTIDSLHGEIAKLRHKSAGSVS